MSADRTGIPAADERHHRRSPVMDRGLAVSVAALGTFAVGAGLVAVRGEIHASVIVLLLATAVVVSARFGGRPAGIGAALMAAAAFDFFHTRPYQSLAIKDGDDVFTTVLLLVVGLVVGGLSLQASAQKAEAKTVDRDGTAMRRVLAHAKQGDADDVETAIRAELLELLRLQRCWYTTDVVALPELGPSGELPGAELRLHEDGFELPLDGFTVPVLSGGERYGAFVCEPVPGVGVHGTNRRTAVALAEIYALVQRPTRSSA